MNQAGVTQPVNDITGVELLLGRTPRPDSQTWTSSCEASVRCVRSQQGGRAPITVALYRHWFPLSPLDHIHACWPPVCRSHWSPHSQLSAVVWFCLGEFKSINSSRQTDTRWWSSCVLSCLNATCHYVGKNKVPQTGQCFHVCLYQILRSWPWVFVVSVQTALAPKPWLKKNVATSLTAPPSSYLLLFVAVEILSPGVEGFIFFSFCSEIISLVIFACSTKHQNKFFPGSFYNIWNWRRKIVSC